MKFSKRITALSLSAALLLNTPAITISASADNTASKVYTYDGYTVEYFVRAEWQGNQNIEVKITNTGTEPITYWSVGYEAGGEISGLWNAQVLGQQGTEYILCGAGYNNEINPNESINFGYTLSGESFKIPQNIVNCAKRADITDDYNVYYNIIGDYGATYQAEMIIENLSDEDISAWSLSFDGNASIDNLWNGKLFENADYHFSVRGDNNTVISANDSVTFNFSGTKSEEWNTDEDNTYEITFENYHLSGIVVSMEYGFEEEIDPELDTDGDGLPDYIEKEIGSDRYKSDTDDDGLPDGYEFYRVGTDPTKADTDDNGISDADEDADDDGLTNIEEYNLGTNPAYYDTDYDGLSDYDELNKYNTDPLVFDTDGDKVSDGDEVTLGLDPKNPATFGYPDNEYTTQQTVNEDDPALQAINSIEDNPFTISVDITAAGVAENCLSASESGYSYPILQNDAVLGVVPELSYSDGLSVTDVVIKFTIDDEAVSDRLGVYSDDPLFDGINRFAVFKYFEEENMLIPIETAYDSVTNSVSAHINGTGTCCVVDVERWANNNENMEPGNYYLENDANNPANIVFCIDTRDIIDSDSFDSIKSSIKEVVDDAFERYTDIKVYVYYQKFASNFKVTNFLLNDGKGNGYFADYKSAEKALNEFKKELIKNSFWAYDFVEATQFMLDTCAENATVNTNDDNKETKTIIYHIVSNKRVMGSSIKAKRLLSTLENDNNIYVNTLCPFSDMTIDELSYAAVFARTSHGMVLTASDYKDYYYENNNKTEQIELKLASIDFASNATVQSEVEETDQKNNDSIYKNLTTILGEGDNRTEFKIISSSGLVPIKLDKQLNTNESYTSNGDKPSDTDDDRLSDWDEVNIDRIKEYIYYTESKDDDRRFYETGVLYTRDLPTFSYCINEITFKYNFDWTVNDLMHSRYYEGPNTKILPITSNPIDPDSDNDGIIDFDDNNELNNKDRSFKEGHDINNASAKSFVVLCNLESVGTVTNSNFYSYPDGQSINVSECTEVNITSIVMKSNAKDDDTNKASDYKYRYYSNGCDYWVKCYCDNKFVYIKFGDIESSISDSYLTNYDISIKTNKDYTQNPNYKSERFKTGWYIPNDGIKGVDYPINIMSQTYKSCAATCEAMAYNYFIDSGRLSGINHFYSIVEDEDIWNGKEAQWFTPPGYDDSFVDGGNKRHLYATLYKYQIAPENKNLANTIDKINSVEYSERIKTNLLDVLRYNLNKHLPVLISCNNGKEGNGNFNHFVLVVGYTGSGTHTDDYIIIDPLTYRTKGSNGGDSLSFAHAAVGDLSTYFLQYHQKYVSTYDKSTGIKYIQFDFTKIEEGEE